MTRYIKPEDDLDRTTVTCYTPTLRDDAQSARELLFQWLAAIPCKETYVALMELTNEYPYKDYTQWMMRAARNRALADADFECWTDKQVHDFDASLVFTPNSPAQLYQMGSIICWILRTGLNVVMIVWLKPIKNYQRN